MAALSRLSLIRNPFLYKSLGLFPSSPSLSLSSSLLHAPGMFTARRGGDIIPPRQFAAAEASSISPASTDHDSRVISADSDNNNSARRKRGGGRRRSSMWRNPRDLVAFGGGLFTPSGIGNALWQTTESINRLLRNLSPSHLFRRMKEDDNSYKLQFEVPGLSKEDLKVTVEDNFLVITGEKKEEEEGGSDEEDYWSSRSYGYYNTSLILPEDAKADEIRAEVKHGVLYVTIPRTGEKKRDVREVEVH